MAEDLPNRDVDQAELARRALVGNMRSTSLLAEEIGKAQLALRDAVGLLASISVGSDDGELALDDNADAYQLLATARRAMRHLARIVNGHEGDLEALYAADAVAQATKRGGQ